MVSTEKRDQLIDKLRILGIQCGTSGDLAVRLRPALIFTPNHANIFLDRLQTALKALQNK
jgi:4-aminobutyrate aminotransferase/(S)-3-amino-2-methylpropionate transaminase